MIDWHPIFEVWRNLDKSPGPIMGTPLYDHIWSNNLINFNNQLGGPLFTIDQIDQFMI